MLLFVYLQTEFITFSREVPNMLNVVNNQGEVLVIQVMKVCTMHYIFNNLIFLCIVKFCDGVFYYRHFKQMFIAQLKQYGKIVSIKYSYINKI